MLTGAEATPAAYVAAHPGRYRLIHFATHATVNPIAPLDSAVICARGGGDYRLYARDVLKLPITADPATISACNSAGTRAYAGEGLVGFAWAFLRAGAHNVIAGLWRVDDAFDQRVDARFVSGTGTGPHTGRSIAGGEARDDSGWPAICAPVLLGPVPVVYAGVVRAERLGNFSYREGLTSNS